MFKVLSCLFFLFVFVFVNLPLVEGDFCVTQAQAKVSKSQVKRSSHRSSSKQKKYSSSTSKRRDSKKGAYSSSRRKYSGKKSRWRHRRAYGRKQAVFEEAETPAVEERALGEFSAAPKEAAGESFFEIGQGKPKKEQSEAALVASGIDIATAKEVVAEDGRLQNQEAGSLTEGGDPNPKLSEAIASLELEGLNMDEDSVVSAEEGRISRRGTLRIGEDPKSMFEGANNKSCKEVFAKARLVYSGSYMPGHFYSVVRDRRGNIKRFEYEINQNRHLVVDAFNGMKAKIEKVSYSYKLTSVIGLITEEESDIFKAVAIRGEAPQLASMLAEVLGSEINFLKDVRIGDSFSLIVEKRYLNGSYYGYGHIVAAAYTSQGKTEYTYFFPDENGKARYYNGQGENARRAFLQAPLAVTRITSKYSMSRRHPILGYSRPHQGVDYAAPSGTPVRAVGDGVVVSHGYAGQGGHMIVLSHAGDMQTYYMHLSRYAKGLRDGAKVCQGQIIGYVGATGLATGPHLDFRIKKGGDFINPVKVINPRKNPISEEEKDRFRRIVALEKDYLSARIPLSEYRPELLQAQ